MDEIAGKVEMMMRELLNVVEINKDLDGELSKNRYDLRENSLARMNEIISGLKKITKNAENFANKAANIHSANNEIVKTWIKPAVTPPNMVAEEICGIKVLARRVEYLEEVGSDLCFMPSINRFAVRFAGILIVGNIGNIYSVCSDPERVKECRFASIDWLPVGTQNSILSEEGRVSRERAGFSRFPTNNRPSFETQSSTEEGRVDRERAGFSRFPTDNRQTSITPRYRIPKCSKAEGDCRFYHNPLVFPSSLEPRNFFATCGHYVANNSPDSKNNNYLRYGSRDSLKDDMSRLTDEESRRFEDYVAHLLLCLIILKRRTF